MEVGHGGLLSGSKLGPPPAAALVSALADGGEIPPQGSNLRGSYSQTFYVGFPLLVALLRFRNNWRTFSSLAPAERIIGLVTISENEGVPHHVCKVRPFQGPEEA